MPGENYQNIVNEYQNQKFRENSKMINTEFRYYLKILTVQDSIATAKVTGKLLPFTQPQIGDKIKNATVYLGCWMTTAKIEEMESKKTLILVLWFLCSWKVV